MLLCDTIPGRREQMSACPRYGTKDRCIDTTKETKIADRRRGRREEQGRGGRAHLSQEDKGLPLDKVESDVVYRKMAVYKDKRGEGLCLILTERVIRGATGAF